MFRSELELGYFLVTILDVLIPYAFGAVAENSLTYNIYTSPSGIQVLDFQCCLHHYTTRFLNKDFDLVSSKNHKVVDFILTKDNPIFLINKAAVELFEHFHNDFEKIQNEVKDRKLVVTGIALGGYIAILYTLWLHHAIDEKRKPGSKITTRPICITFGSPLLGDKALESAISERPEWKSSFLNVVSTSDPFACFFSSNTRYKPIGTFVFCTQSSGHATFEDNDAILAILDKMASSRSGSNPGISRQMHDYENDLRSIRSNVLYRGACEVASELDSNALREGITLQFKEIGALDVSNDLIKKLMEGEHEKMRKRMNTKRLEGNLSKRKIKMAKMELFISSRRSRWGYYDCFKSGPMTIDELPGHNEIINSHESLNQYWDAFVKEKQLMPQKEGVSLRKRWLYSGNNYRRMFEPLYIAEYYKKGNTNYIENRPNRYKLLEEWWNVDKKNLNPNERKAKGPNVNDDSCFWAHVEEALISLRILTNGSSSSNEEYEVEWKLYKFATYVMRLVIDTLVSTRNLSNGSSSSNKEYEAERKLDKFMDYVMRSINDHSLSSDTFLEGSSFMQWWNEYNAYKTGLCTSKFAEYMNSGGYKSYK